MSLTHQDTILRDNIKSNSTQSGVKLILLPLQQCTHWQTYWGLDKLPTPRRQYLVFSFYINPCILIKISPEFVPTSHFFYNKSTLIQVMAWGQTGYKPLPEFEGILPKGPYQPCVSMAGRALLAGYHWLLIMTKFTDQYIVCVNWPQYASTEDK